MYVIAHHRIVDPARFRALAAAPVVGRPAHWRLISAAPTRDGAACFSLWWADSAAALQPVLARAVGDAGSVVCYDVDEDDALGLEGKPIVVVRVAPPWRAKDGGAGSRHPTRDVTCSSAPAPIHASWSVRRQP
jgi:hypothetical protein